MRTQIRFLGTAAASAVLGLTLVAAPTFAATPSDAMQFASVDGSQPQRVDRPDHERRFCVKLEHLLRKLVEKGVITAQEAARILNAVGCSDANTTAPAN